MGVAGSSSAGLALGGTAGFLLWIVGLCFVWRARRWTVRQKILAAVSAPVGMILVSVTALLFTIHIYGSFDTAVRSMTDTPVMPDALGFAILALGAVLFGPWIIGVLAWLLVAAYRADRKELT